MHLFRFRERLRHSGCRILEPVNVIAVREVQSAERWSPRYSREKKKRECVRYDALSFRAEFKSLVLFLNFRLQFQFQFEFALVTVYYHGVSR